MPSDLSDNILIKSRESGILFIPDETLIQIFSNLEPEELISASLVCSHWYHTINDENSWREALKSKFNGVLPFNYIDISKLSFYHLNHSGSINSYLSKKIEILDTDGHPSVHAEEYAQELRHSSFYDSMEQKLNSTSFENKNLKILKPKFNNYKSMKSDYSSNYFSKTSLNKKNKMNLLHSWKMEYICRIELLKQWNLGRNLFKTEVEIGIGTIHEIHSDFKYNWIFCASLTHGVAIKTSLKPGNLGKIKNFKHDISFATGFSRNQRNNRDNIFEQLGNTGDLYNFPLNPVSSNRMQTVKFFNVRFNSYYQNSSTSCLTDRLYQSNGVQNTYVKSQPKDIVDTESQNLAIIWGGYYEGRISVQYINRVNGMPKIFVLMEKKFWHNGSVTSLIFVEQMNLTNFPFKNDYFILSKSIDSPIFKNVVVSGGSDSTVKFWDAENGEFLWSFKVSQYPNIIVTSIQTLSSRYIIIGTNEGVIFVIDTLNPDIFSESHENYQTGSYMASDITVSKMGSPITFRSKFKPIIAHPEDFSFQPINRNALFKSFTTTVTHILTNHQSKTVLVASVSIFHKPDGTDSSVLNDTQGSSFKNSAVVGNLCKINIETGKPIKYYSWSGNSPISAINWGSGGSSNSDETIIAGDSSGNIFLWSSASANHKTSNFGHLSSPVLENVGTSIDPVPPTSSLIGAHLTTVDSINYDGLKIISTSRDGKVCLWEPLNMTPIRSIRCRGIGELDSKKRSRRFCEQSSTEITSAMFPIIKGVDNPESLEDISTSRKLSKLTKSEFEDIYKNLKTPIFKELFFSEGLNRSNIENFPNQIFMNMHSPIDRQIGQMHPLYCSLANNTESTYEFLVISSGTHLVFLSCGSAVFATLGPIFGIKDQHRFSNTFPTSNPLEDYSQTALNDPQSKISAPRIVALNKPTPFNNSPISSLKSDRKKKLVRTQDDLLNKKEMLLDIENEIEKHKDYSSIDRELRIADHETREYLDNEYIQPLLDLKLDDEDIMKYVEFLSTSELVDSSSKKKDSEFILEGLNEDEMLEYALFLSKS
ncbi:hypothetical protein AYI68_g678 [Smittium mucronatum]|uniref:F-box domain-containing protein n=1 Tax=Smittium mucronatum TaxID=133383 RepID=A0A1R0H7L8_9FUNG|nr:hypothetical protein AYI68_g678 [Smittium mucronatum]